MAMKILLVHRNSFDVIGGVEGTLYCMAESIKRSGHIPIIAAQQSKRNGVSKEKTDVCLVRRYRSVHVPRLLLFFSPVFEFHNAMRYLREIILDEQPDLIIVRDNILSYAVSRFFDRKKIVYVPLGVMKYYNSERYTKSAREFLIEQIRRMQLRFESYYQIRAFLTLKHIAVFSENMKKQVYRATKGKVTPAVIHPGVSARFLKEPSDAFDFRVWNADTNNKNFLFVGRLAQEKNLRMLITAFSRMEKKDTNLWIVGDGPEMANLKLLADHFHLSDRIIFTGATRETERFYHMADFFLLPSYYESFGNVILESFASGTPVLGFKTLPGKTLTAVEELVDDGVTGIVCCDFSEVGLTESLNRARTLCDSADYQTIRENCKTTVSGRFTWERFIHSAIALTEK